MFDSLWMEKARLHGLTDALNNMLRNTYDEPYLLDLDIKLMYNAAYGDKRICKCTHEYKQHFDELTFAPIGCSCGCIRFVELTHEGESP